MVGSANPEEVISKHRKKVAEQIRSGNLEKKSLFRIKVYRQPLNEMRVGLQDKRPKAEAETMEEYCLLACPT